MTLCLQIIRNELQSWKSRNITLCAGSSLSLALIRCPPRAVLCMEALLETYCLQMGFSTFSNPNLFGGNPRIILFGAATWFYL